MRGLEEDTIVGAKPRTLPFLVSCLFNEFPPSRPSRLVANDEFYSKISNLQNTCFSKRQLIIIYKFAMFKRGANTNDLKSQRKLLKSV